MLVDDSNIPQILALDFDGVICDGLIDISNRLAHLLSNGSLHYRRHPLI